VYLTNEINVTDELITNYMTFLLSGFTIKNIEIPLGTIKGYTAVINNYYKQQGMVLPFGVKSQSRAAKLLREQEKFKSDPAQREPILDLAWVKMSELASEDELGFRATVFDIATVGKYGRLRQQEFAMDLIDVIKIYELPNGVEVMRAFCIRNVHYQDENRDIVHPRLVKENEIEELETEYDVQKNRRNGQIVWFCRERQ